VFALRGGRAGKVGTSEASLRRERSVMERVQAAAAAAEVCPALRGGAGQTGGGGGAFGFQMGRHGGLGGMETEEEVARVVGQLFWRLAVLHELGIAHNDVKPSNVVVAAARGEGAAEAAYLLCDFGHAGAWSAGEPLFELRGATEAFRVMPGV